VPRVRGNRSTNIDFDRIFIETTGAVPLLQDKRPPFKHRNLINRQKDQIQLNLQRPLGWVHQEQGRVLGGAAGNQEKLKPINSGEEFSAENRLLRPGGGAGRRGGW
jgi:hypothetical protein